MRIATIQDERVPVRRLRLAEASSGIGALVLGIGIGVLAAGHLERLGLPVLAVGLLLHGWGMTDKHRLERGSGAPSVWWATLLYWFCWACLAVLVVYVVWQKI